MILATIVHDPDGKLVSFTRDYFKVDDIYSDIVIQATSQTSSKLLNILDSYNLQVSDRNLGEARMAVLGDALKLDTSLIHYVDYDRLLFWQAMFPKELQSLPLHPEKMTVIGRSPLAFASHPRLQQKTEQISNMLVSDRISQKMDVLSGSRGIPKLIGEKILEKSVLYSCYCATDAEWPLIAKDHLHYVEVDGLSYETDFLGLAKPWDVELRTRINNLNSIVKVIEHANYYND